MAKQEHIVWAYADKEDGTGSVLIIGVTNIGLEYLKEGEAPNKGTLVVNPPGRGFANVTQIIIFHEKDKATLKERFRQAGAITSEVM